MLRGDNCQFHQREGKLPTIQRGYAVVADRDIRITGVAWTVSWDLWNPSPPLIDENNSLIVIDPKTA